MEETTTKTDMLKNTDYLFIFKELENLVNYTSEAVIIKEVFELLNKLFVPQQIVFIDYSYDCYGKKSFYRSPDNNILQKDDYSFLSFEIENREEILGVIEIYGIGFPEYIEEYKKIGTVICSICRAALSNARKFKIIETQKEQLQIYSEQLIEVVQAKDKFFSIIAHDLRAPFSSFMGLSTLLADDFAGISFKMIRQLTSKMKDSAISLYELLENLLEWARCQQGMIIFNPEKLDLISVVKNSLQLLNNVVVNKNIKITYHIPQGQKIYADLKMLQTILRNLISNSLKFTPKDGEIEIMAEAGLDGGVMISIRDHGIGIPSNMLDNLFSIKVKTNRKGTEGEPSSGLGLLICKEFVEKLGGCIRVESEEGKGSTFSFTLPSSNPVSQVDNTGFGFQNQVNCIVMLIMNLPFINFLEVF